MKNEISKYQELSHWTKVYDALVILGETDRRSVAKYLKTDLCNVTAPIKYMIDEGILTVLGKRKNRWTGRVSEYFVLASTEERPCPIISKVYSKDVNNRGQMVTAMRKCLKYIESTPELYSDVATLKGKIQTIIDMVSFDVTLISGQD